MTRKTYTRIGLGICATVVAAMVVGIAHKNISAQGRGFGGPGVGRFGGGPGGGPDGPGGPGGPGGRRGGPGGPGGLGGLMLDRLDLTNDQHDRVRQILDSHRDDQKALGDRAMKAHDALQEVITGNGFDESAIRARSAEVAAVDADMAVAQGRIFSEVFQILTADQQQKFRKLQADMKERRAKGAEQRQQGGRRGGPR